MTATTTPAIHALGVTGDSRRGSLSEAVWSGAGWLPVVLLGLMDGLVIAQGIGLLEVDAISTATGHTQGTTYFLLFFFWTVGLTAAAPFGLRLALERVDRSLVLAVGLATVGVGVVGVASATSRTALGIAAGVAGVGSMLVGSARRPLLADLYPPAARGRVTGMARGVGVLTVVVAGVIAVLLPDTSGMSWRLGLGLVGAATLLVAALAGSLPDAEVGGIDGEVIRGVLGAAAPGDLAPRQPGLSESVRRVAATRTAKPLLTLLGVAAALTLILPLYGGFALSERGGASRDVMWFCLLCAAVIAAATALLAGPSVEAAVRRHPETPLHVLTIGLLGGGALLAVTGWLPLVGQAIAICAVAGLVALVVVVVDTLLATTMPGTLRPAAATVAVVVAAASAMASTNLLSRADGEWGIEVALLITGLVTMATAAVARSATVTVAGDYQRIVDELIEFEELAAERKRGHEPPLLSCRRLNFSYGPLQVLFDVDFTVETGEMVALLGTNGAGKSTLLRALSGVGMPSSGTVRFNGADITYAEPGERVKAGISQIPGGKAVFGPLSVVENLRLYGYALGRDRKAVDRGIDEAMDTFPRLAERRNALASTMSGGEQQMLAMSKALILAPQLLLIDELSLGLAPKIVGELLVMVRTINATGTAVVLVEQSVNVALTLAHRAYFMEKGSVRFEGPTAELLERPDVLRSVFLQGAAKGLAAQ